MCIILCVKEKLFKIMLMSCSFLPNMKPFCLSLKIILFFSSSGQVFISRVFLSIVVLCSCMVVALSYTGMYVGAEMRVFRVLN